MNKQRKSLLIVLGLAGAGVAIDQVMTGDGRPQSAAADVPRRQAPSSGAASQNAAASRSDGERNGLADAARALERLRSVAGDGRDAFAPGEVWLRTPESIDAASVVVARFEADHRLSSVVRSSEEPGAIVNGVFVRIGEEVAGFTLVRVGEREAVFSRAELVATLRLPSGAERDPRIR